MDLGKILASEKGNEKPQELPEFFYLKAQRQISAQQAEYQSLGPDNYEGQLLGDAISADKRLLSIITTKRITKILKAAALDAMKHHPKPDPANLLPREKAFYLSVFENIKSAMADLEQPETEGNNDE